MAFPVSANAVKFGEFPWVGDYSSVEGKVDEAHLASLTLAYEQWMDSLISMGRAVMRFDDRLGLIYELVSRAHLRVGLARQLIRSRATARNPCRMYRGALCIAEARLGFVSDFEAINAAKVVRTALESMRGGREKIAELIAEQTPVLSVGFGEEMDICDVVELGVMAAGDDSTPVGLGIDSNVTSVTGIDLSTDVGAVRADDTGSPVNSVQPPVTVDRYGYVIPTVAVVLARDGELAKPAVPFATVGPVEVFDADGVSHQKFVQLLQTDWQVANVELVDPYDFAGKSACHAVTMLEAVNSIMVNRVHVDHSRVAADVVNSMTGSFGTIRFQVCWAEDVGSAVLSLATGEVSLAPGHMTESVFHHQPQLERKM